MVWASGTMHPARYPGILQQGDLLGVSLTRMVELDVTFVHTIGTAGRTQGAHKEAGKSVKIREATKKKHHANAGTSGYTYATLAMRRMGIWETKQRNRSGC